MEEPRDRRQRVSFACPLSSSLEARSQGTAVQSLRELKTNGSVFHKFLSVGTGCSIRVVLLFCCCIALFWPPPLRHSGGVS